MEDEGVAWFEIRTRGADADGERDSAFHLKHD